MGNIAATQTAPRPGRNNAKLRYVARQPIFDRDEKVFGYELLFRDGLENAFHGADMDAASRTTLDNSLLLGLDVLCDGKRAFINCTRNTLIQGLVRLMPPQLAVVEVLEDVPADAEVVEACRALKQAGYMIALDDVVADDPRAPLIDLADIIKVEMKLTSPAQQVALVKRFSAGKCRVLAEKVETHQEFAAAREKGFHYFQGYFFRKPEILTTQTIPANQLNYLRLLQAVSQPTLDVRGLEKLIKGEVSICYRLLRYMNSAMFGFQNEIHSVRHALSILGEREVRRWVRLVAAVGASQDKPSDLLLSALVRARFGELLTTRVTHGDSDLFLLGLLSLIDAMLDTPMEVVLEKIPLDHETKEVLLSRPSALRPIYRLMLAHESGEWDAAAALSESLKLDAGEVAGFYWQAQQWAREVSAGG